jgi:hypothetical protein
MATSNRDALEACLAKLLVEGRQLYIIMHEHRHGADLWPRMLATIPDIDAEKAACEDWENRQDETMSWYGPYALDDPAMYAALVPAPRRFLNHYRCDTCQEEWNDCWDSACNDKCPRCNTEIEPYDSERCE